ncbi:MAG: M14 family zinc carboxypeptidase [Phycisphaerales bacterium JB039]
MVIRTHVRCGIAALAVAACAAVAQQQEPYRNHALVSVDAPTPRQMLAITQLTDDIWTHTPRPGAALEFRVTPEQLDRLRQLGIEHRVLIEDIQAEVDAERARLAAGQPADAGWYDDYKTYDEHKLHAQELAAASAGLATFEIVGPSLEGREMFAIRIDDPAGDPDRPVIVLQAGQHAREWIAPMTAQYIAETLLTSTDPRLDPLVQRFEWIIIPTMNPDGYDYTWTDLRLWRKNRRDNGDGTFGVDLNRNWSYQWGGAGSSGQTGSETYRGVGPFSEVELQSFLSYIDPYTARMAVHIDLHSYGQLILSPWSYTDSLVPPDIDLFNELGKLMSDAIFSVHGASYTYGPGGSTLYLAAGVAPDWGYAEHGALSWTIELRPIGSPGFQLPPDGIIPTVEETVEAIIQLAESISAPLRFTVAAPSTITPDAPYNFEFGVADGIGTVDPASVRGYVRLAGASMFDELVATDLGAGQYSVTLPETECGGILEFYLSAATTTGDSATFPAGAPDDLLSAEALAIMTTLADDVETDLGWIVGAPGDTATTGIWGRSDPEATAAQPGDDHTPDPGVNCWVTDGRAGSGVGTWDVDGGATTLTSYSFDASEPFDILNADPMLSFWVWYSNDQGSAPGTDSMPILISNDGGVSWVEMESIGVSTIGWEQRSYRIGDFVAPSEDMRLRVVARDDEPGSIVEAAIDDIELMFAGCARHPADFTRDGVLDIFDFLEFQNLFAVMDPKADLTGDGLWDIFDFLLFQNLFEGG